MGMDSTNCSALIRNGVKAPVKQKKIKDAPESTRKQKLRTPGSRRRVGDQIKN